jgi:hypothetical protein
MKNPKEVELDLEILGHVRPARSKGRVGALQFSGRKVSEVRFVVAVSEDYETSLKMCNTYLSNVEKILEWKRRVYEENRVQVVDGYLNGCAQAVTQAIYWNTVWDPYNNRVYTPVSRVWAYDYFGGYVVFEWDTFFNALLSSIEDLEISEANIKVILSELTPRGVIPNVISVKEVSLDRSQPPVGTYIVWKIYKLSVHHLSRPVVICG